MRAKTVQPWSNRILVEPLPENRRIILTDAPPLRRCKVLAVGPKCYETQAGDIVFLPGIAAEEPDFRIDNAILVTEDDIGFKEAV